MKRIVGNVGAFLLPNGMYAFGRIFKDADVGFYKHFGINENDLPPDDDYAFIVGTHKDVIKIMKLVERRKIKDSKDVEPPAKCIVDPITGKCEIYVNGKIMQSNYNECKDLEICAVWELNHIIDRLMGNNKWQEGFLSLNQNDY